MFPPVPVQFKSDEYYIYDKGDWFRTSAQKRAPRTESAGTGWNISKDSYACDVNAVHVDIADQDRANQDSVLNYDRDATVLITRDILLRRELDWVDAYFGPGKWATTDQVGAATAGTDQFIQWDRANSTPIEDITHQRINMAENTGLKPNIMAIGARVYEAWKNHDQFLARIIYTQKGVVTLDLIAGLLDLDAVYTPMTIQNSAEEGATDELSFVHGKAALLAYRPPSPGLMTPSAGYTFEWVGYIGAAQRGTRMKKFRMEALAADRVEVESAYDFKQVSPDLAVYFTSAVQ
jgi:hypothetical protein